MMVSRLQVYHSGCPWAAAQRHLRDMAAYKVSVSS